MGNIAPVASPNLSLRKNEEIFFDRKATESTYEGFLNDTNVVNTLREEADLMFKKIRERKIIGKMREENGIILFFSRRTHPVISTIFQATFPPLLSHPAVHIIFSFILLDGDSFVFYLSNSLLFQSTSCKKLRTHQRRFHGIIITKYVSLSLTLVFYPNRFASTIAKFSFLSLTMMIFYSSKKMLK
jgi:hypothetical protein